MTVVNSNNSGSKFSGNDYPLPEDRIAIYPVETRHDSKLLIYEDGKIQDSIFKEVAGYLPENSLLVFNNTRVIRARMHFAKSSGSKIEIFCLEPYEPSDYERALASKENSKWICLVGNLKKWKNEVLEKVIFINKGPISILAKKSESHKEYQVVEFSWQDSNLSFAEILECAGETPIPPYLNRKPEISDNARYQTVYAASDGSVAAPTAGLHFTEEVMKSLSENHVQRMEVTLHVGAGTFKPMVNNSAEEHNMHSEHFSITRNSLERLLMFNGKIIAVGTTSVRCLESLYYCGLQLLRNEKNTAVELHVQQWEWKDNFEEPNLKDSLSAIMRLLDRTKAGVFHASSQIMIIPGYKFKFIDGLITNFHQPRSTLLLLVSAFIGEDWKKVYSHALDNNYRFLSYGDSSLLINPRNI